MSPPCEKFISLSQFSPTSSLVSREINKILRLPVCNVRHRRSYYMPSQCDVSEYRATGRYRLPLVTLLDKMQGHSTGPGTATTEVPPVEYEPASMPSANPTQSFWIHSSPDANPLAREGSEGPLITDADICIIGSGITGVGVAYHLSEASETLIASDKPSLRVLILEAREFC